MCCCRKGGVSSATAGFVVIAGAVVASHNQKDEPAAVAPVSAPATAARLLADVSGDWEGRAFGEAFPEDVPLFVTLIMEEDGAVTGTFEIPEGEAPFQGEFDQETGVLTGDVTPEDGSNWEITLTLDEDELSGPAKETNSGVEAEVELERAEG